MGAHLSISLWHRERVPPRRSIPTSILWPAGPPSCTEKTWYGKEESKSKAGIAAAFGSVLDYNVGVAWAPTSKSTGSERFEI